MYMCIYIHIYIYIICVCVEHLNRCKTSTLSEFCLKRLDTSEVSLPMWNFRVFQDLMFQRILTTSCLAGGRGIQSGTTSNEAT